MNTLITLTEENGKTIFLDTTAGIITGMDTKAFNRYIKPNNKIINDNLTAAQISDMNKDLKNIGNLFNKI